RKYERVGSACTEDIRLAARSESLEVHRRGVELARRHARLRYQAKRASPGASSRRSGAIARVERLRGSLRPARLAVERGRGVLCASFRDWNCTGEVFARRPPGGTHRARASCAGLRVEQGARGLRACIWREESPREGLGGAFPKWK